MKISVSHQLVKCAAFVAVLCCVVAGRAEGETNKASKITPPALIRSVFVAEAPNGKDPFFPASTRRIRVIEQPVVVVPNTTNTAPVQNLLADQLVLKGISGPLGQRLALINSSTVGVGEFAEIRCGVQYVKIRCREIRDRSVLIELVGGGEIRELKFRQGIN